MKFSVFLAVLILYLCTLAPDLVWQDQGDYQYQVAKCNLSRPGDLVRVHPLYILTAHAVGKLGPFSYAYSANLVSAIFMAVTVANVYMLVVLLAGSTWPGLLAAAVFAFAHTVWFLAVQAQTYALAMAMMSSGLLCAIAYFKNPKTWQLLLMGLFFGLGVSVHMMSQITFVVIMAWLFVRCVRGSLRVAPFVGIILCWIIGAAALWVVAWIEYRHNGSIAATIRSAIVGQWGSEVFNLNQVGLLIKKSVQLFVLNFPTPLVVLMIPGIALSFKRLDKTIAYLLATCTLLYCIFAARYNVRNMDFFFLPFYLFTSVYIGLGFAFLFEKHKRLAAIACGVLAALIPFTYIGIAHIAKAKNFDLGVRRQIPYRDVYQYYLIPWQQHQTGPRRLVTEVLSKVPQGSFIIPDSTTISGFLYAHEIEGQRPDVKVISFGAPKSILEELRSSGARAFTMSDVKGYYPSWVADTRWLKPFPISETQHIFEIIIPDGVPPAKNGSVQN